MVDNVFSERYRRRMIDGAIDEAFRLIEKLINKHERESGSALEELSNKAERQEDLEAVNATVNTRQAKRQRQRRAQKALKSHLKAARA
jgi:hypothetical protein